MFFKGEEILGASFVSGKRSDLSFWEEEKGKGKGKGRGKGRKLAGCWNRLFMYIMI